MTNTKFTDFVEKTTFDDKDDIIPVVDVSAGSVASATVKLKQGTLFGKIQDGSIVYAADSGANDAYAITMDTATRTPTGYTTGMVVHFKANTANTGAATLNINALGAKTIKKNHDQDLADGDIESGQIVTVVYDGTNFQMQSQLANQGVTIGANNSFTGNNSFSGTTTFTGAVTNSSTTTLTGNVIAKLFAPQGFLINGKLSVTVSSNDLIVTLKTLSGGDPSTSDPVYCRIGDTVRPVTGALSVTAADGTNWFNAGSSELATKEIDYFAYLGYNATDGVVLGFSRFPGATQYSDFSTTSTNEKYCRISTITTAASTDYYEVVGRFAATLSAGAGYTWSVPTYTAINLIQRPIYETRWLTYAPLWSSSGTQPVLGSSTITGRYKVKDAYVHYTGKLTITTGGAFSAGTGTYRFGFPFTSTATIYFGTGLIFDSGTAAFPALPESQASTSYAILYQTSNGNNCGATVPMTPATSDYYVWTGMIEI